MNATHFWTADQLQVMRGLELPIWFRAVINDDNIAVQASTQTILQTIVQTTATLIPETLQQETRQQSELNTALQPESQPELPAAKALPTTPIDWLLVCDQALSQPALTLLGNMLVAAGKNLDTVHIAPLLSTPNAASAERNGSETDPFSDVVLAGVATVESSIHTLQPKCVVAFGSLAAQALLGIDGDFNEITGELHEYEHLPLLVLHDLQDLLKTPHLKAQTWRDLNMLLNAA